MALSPPDPRALLREAGLEAKKSWGQNFLCDQNILAAIAAATGTGPDLPVVELGAGLGALTFHLLARGGSVIAVERDRELVPLLRRVLADPRLEILEADAAAVSYAELATRGGGVPVVCGNLPYQLSSRIIVAIADQVRDVRRAVFMVQREVADRLAAAPGSRTFGLLSVLVQRAFEIERVRNVPPGAFHPRPKVSSAVVRLEPRAQLYDEVTDRHLVAAARAAFASRRKTLRNSLGRALSAAMPEVEAAIARAGLDPGTRAETLTIAEFARLGEALAAHKIVD